MTLPDRGARTGTVLRMASAAAQRRRTEREATELIDEAIASLLAVRRGDVEAMWTAVNRAALLLLQWRGDVA